MSAMWRFPEGLLLADCCLWSMTESDLGYVKAVKKKPGTLKKLTFQIDCYSIF